MGETEGSDPAWATVRAQLRRAYPAFYELEAEGALYDIEQMVQWCRGQFGA